MKKVFMLLMAAATLSACNNDGTSTEEVKDSVLENIDSTGDARVDAMKDSTENLKDRVEETFEKADSANEALMDSVDKKIN